MDLGAKLAHKLAKYSPIQVSSLYLRQFCCMVIWFKYTVDPMGRIPMGEICFVYITMEEC